jgi:GT2 family glycosyltransferase
MVSIIIPCLNNLDLTKQCVQSIVRNTHKVFTPYQIILVDNGSADGTGEHFRYWADEWFETYVLIENTENLGYVHAANQGLARADGDYALLLNNDTVVTPHWLERMLQPFTQFPQLNLGIVGPRSNYCAMPQMVADAPKEADVAQIDAFAEQLAQQEAGQFTVLQRVIGFCVLISRPVIDAIGGLDPRFGVGNFDDDDYCIRARLAGFEVGMVHDAYVHHVGHATFNQFPASYYNKLMQDNWKTFAKKWRLPVNIPPQRGYDNARIFERTYTEEHLYVPLTPFSRK